MKRDSRHMLLTGFKRRHSLLLPFILELLRLKPLCLQVVAVTGILLIQPFCLYDFLSR
ncbi:hypothetical protein D3C85_1542160 [compost metagenome]